MLRHRLTYGPLMILVALCVLVLDSRFAPYYPLLFVAASFMVWVAAGELCQMIERLPLRIRHPRFARFGTLLVCWGNWLPAIMGGWSIHLGLNSPTIKSALSVFVAVVLFGFVLTARNYRKPGDSTLAIAGYLFVFFYVGLLSSLLFQLRWISSDPTMGAAALVLTILTCKLGDAGAFFVGRSMGRTKIAPVLSPGKSLEGALGGLTAAVATAVWLGAFPIPFLTASPLLDVINAALFGVFVGIMAQVGDLMESLIKRDCEVKDAGQSIPGFGGLLDIADSILFGAPGAYFFLVGMKSLTRGELPGG